MSARHRLSKLLLRQGIVYYGGKPWTGSHDLWLRARRRTEVFTVAGLGLAFDIAYDTTLATVARRERLDGAIAAMAADSEFTPVATRLGCLRGGVDVDLVRAGRGDRGLDLALGPLDRRLPGFGADRVVLGWVAVSGVDHEDRERAPGVDRGGVASRRPYRRPGIDLQRRWEKATPEARDRGQRTNRRLHE